MGTRRLTLVREFPSPRRSPVVRSRAREPGALPPRAGDVERILLPGGIMTTQPRGPAVRLVAALGMAFLAGTASASCPGMATEGRGAAPGCQQGRGGRHGDDDHATFHFLLDAHDRIRRRTTDLPNGVETLTESDDPEVAARIETHVRAMEARLVSGRPIHARDPLFAELFRHADAIEIVIEPTPKGVRVRETSSDPYVVELIQAHAEVVSAFVANGHAEMRKNHDVPPR